MRLPVARPVCEEEGGYEGGGGVVLRRDVEFEEVEDAEGAEEEAGAPEVAVVGEKEYAEGEADDGQEA